MNGVNFYGVAAESLARTWPHVREYVLSALAQSQGEFDETAVYHAVQDGSMQLWVLWEKGDGVADEVLGAAVTQIIEFPTRVIVEVMLAGGREFSKWGSQIAVIEAWGLERGADEVRFVGRPGFERAMGPLGYRKIYTVCSKALGVKH